MGITFECMPVDALWIECVSVNGFDCTEERTPGLALGPAVPLPAARAFCASGSRLIVDREALASPCAAAAVAAARAACPGFSFGSGLLSTMSALAGASLTSGSSDARRRRARRRYHKKSKTTMTRPTTAATTAPATAPAAIPWPELVLELGIA